MIRRGAWFLPCLSLILAQASTFALGLALVSQPSATSLLRGDPKQFVLEKSDLPVAFAIGSGDYQGDSEYASVFLRPEVLADAEIVKGALLGVMVGLELKADRAAADVTFRARSTAGEIRGSISRSGGEQLSSTEKLNTDFTGVDDALLFRVEYELAGVRVVEYRYRIRVANAVANVIVSGRVGTSGGEPAGLARQARGIAEKQVARMRNEGSGAAGS